MRFMVALLVLALSGCVSTPHNSTAPAPVELSPAQYAILDPVETWVTASDGKAIHNAVYLPDVPEGQTMGVFINFSPYWGDSAMTRGDGFAKYMIDEYVPRGFAVVLSAVRGTGHSEGCFQIAGDLELRDAYDVVDYFAKAPFSNGRVAAGGKSYDSTTQNGMIAKFPHPALTGIFHVSGITDMYRYNYVGGVPYQNGLTFTPRYFVQEGLDEYGLPGLGTGNTDEDPESLARIVDDAACPELPKHVASAEGSAVTGQKDAYWQERDWNRFLADSEWNGTVFFVHGLQDWNVKPDHILPWLETVQANGWPVLGWLHQDTFNTGHVYPMRSDWNATMLSWLDYTLNGKATMDGKWGISSQGTDGVWRTAAHWPPALQATGKVAGNVPMDVSGPGRIAGVFHFTVNATVVDPDAVATVVVRDVAGRWVTEGVLRALYANGLDTPQPVAPGQQVSLRFDSYPVDFVIREGDTVSLTGQASPVHSVVSPVQLAGLANVVMTASFAMVSQEPDAVQPAPTSCWAC